MQIDFASVAKGRGFARMCSRTLQSTCAIARALSYEVRLLVALMILLGSGTFLIAQSTSPGPATEVGLTKVAIIDFQRAVSQSIEFQHDVALLQKEFEPRRQQLKTEQDDIANLAHLLQSQGGTLNAGERSSLTNTIDEKKKQFQHDSQAANADFGKEMGHAFQSVGTQMLAVIQSSATQQGYSVVLDISQNPASVLYALRGIKVTKASLNAGHRTDITNQVLDAYNRNSGIPSPPRIANLPTAVAHESVDTLYSKALALYGKQYYGADHRNHETPGFAQALIDLLRADPHGERGDWAYKILTILQSDEVAWPDWDRVIPAELVREHRAPAASTPAAPAQIQPATALSKLNSLLAQITFESGGHSGVDYDQASGMLTVTGRNGTGKVTDQFAAPVNHLDLGHIVTGAASMNGLRWHIDTLWCTGRANCASSLIYPPEGDGVKHPYNAIEIPGPAQGAKMDAALRDFIQAVAPDATVAFLQERDSAASQAGQQASTAEQQQVDEAARAQQAEQDRQNQIAQLQDDMQEQEQEAQNWDNQANNASNAGSGGCAAGSYNALCSSITGAIQDFGAAKARQNAAEARQKAEDDREQIEQLENQPVQHVAIDTSYAGALTQQTQGQPMPNIQDTLAQQESGIYAVGACSACSSDPSVARYTAECKNGSISACYRAAAALCECHLNTGGCGGNLQDLRECVRANTKYADSMRGGYTITSGGKTAAPTTPNGNNPKATCNSSQGMCAGTAY